MTASATISEPAHVLLLRNPKAGAESREELIADVVRQLTARGLVTSVFGDIDALAEEAAWRLADGSLRCVVAAGGDGTAALVANRTAAGTPLTVLPLGTENLLAKYLGLRADAEFLANVIAARRIVRLDAGEANGRLFLLMLGCGFDADVVRRLHDSRDGHIHHLSYAKPIFDAIRSYDYPELRIYCRASDATERSVTQTDATQPADDSKKSPDIVARWAFVVNLPRYAGGLRLAPSANGTDGLLDVCTFKAGSLWNGLWYLGEVTLGTHAQSADCVLRHATEVRIEADREVYYQLDGDPGGVLPVHVRVLPRRLTLLVPEDFF